MRVVRHWSRLLKTVGQCPIPGNFPGQVGRGSEHPDPGEDGPAGGRRLDWMACKGPFPPKAFCDSMILSHSRTTSTEQRKASQRR